MVRYNEIDTTIRLSKEIDFVAEPLKKFGITYFSYGRVYKDGKRLHLNNHPAITEWYFIKNKRYLTNIIDSNPHDLPDKMYLWNAYEDYDDFKISREAFNTSHGITLVEKYQDFTELWNFATTRENKAIVNFYMNHMGILYNFMYYFREKLFGIMKSFSFNFSESIKLMNSETAYSLNTVTHPTIPTAEINNHFDIKRFFIKSNDETYLTIREVECLQWFLKGKTYIEMSMILGISQKTIEIHIDNIKKKLSCYKQAQLASKGFDLKIDSICLSNHELAKATTYN